jgi:hypothetical protein
VSPRSLSRTTGGGVRRPGLGHPAGLAAPRQRRPQQSGDQGAAAAPGTSSMVITAPIRRPVTSMARSGRRPRAIAVIRQRHRPMACRPPLTHASASIYRPADATGEFSSLPAISSVVVYRIVDRPVALASVAYDGDDRPRVERWAVLRYLRRMMRGGPRDSRSLAHHCIIAN